MEIWIGYLADNEGNVYLQFPEENQWGFTVLDDDLTYPGGFLPGNPTLRAISDDDPLITDDVRLTYGEILFEKRSEFDRTPERAGERR